MCEYCWGDDCEDETGLCPADPAHPRHHDDEEG